MPRPSRACDSLDAGAARPPDRRSAASAWRRWRGCCKQRGLRVTGSDEKIYPPMSTLLERLGIPVLRRLSAGEPDAAARSGGHRQQGVARQPRGAGACSPRGLPYLSLPEALGELFLAGRRSLVVAGTHGKTTSTAMLAWVLERAGRDPSLMVGGESLDFGGNFKLGAGEFFVIEGDEYDSAFFDKGPKFLHYRPSAAILDRGRVRPRRHLPRPRRGEGRLPPLRRPAAAPARRWWWRRTSRTRSRSPPARAARASCTLRRQRRRRVAARRPARPRRRAPPSRVRRGGPRRGRAAPRGAGAHQRAQRARRVRAGARDRPRARRDRRRAWRASRASRAARRWSASSAA